MVFDRLRLLVANGTTQPATGYYDLRVQTMMGSTVAQGNPGVPIDFIKDGQLFKVGIVTNENGWINYILAASLVGNPGTTHSIRAIVDGQTITSNTVTLVIQSEDAPPPPPPPPDPCASCAPGTHCENGMCVPDPVPPPPALSFIDKLTALFPDQLKPYALPISVVVAAMVLKKWRR